VQLSYFQGVPGISLQQHSKYRLQKARETTKLPGVAFTCQSQTFLRAITNRATTKPKVAPATTSDV
jgi:hypothetical protein